MGRSLRSWSVWTAPKILLIVADIFVNCIYLSKAGPLFLTFKDVENHELRQLSVVADVSCDTTNPHNPIPIYSINTTFAHPVVNVETAEGSKPLSVISIDHLPTMLPRESSEAFSSALLESLLALKDQEHARVWTDAEKLFKEKVATVFNFFFLFVRDTSYSRITTSSQSILSCLPLFYFQTLNNFPNFANRQPLGRLHI